jgi:uncharacterized membrane protein YjgN (DUF898 family)
MTNDSVRLSSTSGPKPEGPLGWADYAGSVGQLYSLVVVNLLLSVVTVGFYRFWGTVRVRRYLWQSIRVFGEPFEYTGTGGELCRSFFKAMGFLFVAALVFGGIQAALPKSRQPLVLLAFYPFFFFVVAMASFGARRYRLSRTLWRGLELAQEGSSLEYALLWLKTTVLCGLTLGLYVPYARMRLAHYVWNRSYVGREPFQLEVDGRELFRTYLKAWLLMVPTLGISLLWFEVQEMKYLARKLTIAQVSFSWTPSFGQTFAFLFGNAVILLLTLGLGQPLVTHRSLRFFAGGLLLRGTPDFARLQRGVHTRTKAGEGLVDLLDVGVA